MSQTVSFDFERIGIECCEVCDRVESRIAELHKLLGVLERACSDTPDEQTRSFVNSIEAEITQWLAEAADIRDNAERIMRKGHWHGDSDSRTFRNRYRLKDNVYDLKRKINAAVAERKPAVRAVISQVKATRFARLNNQNRTRQHTGLHQNGPSDSIKQHETISRIGKLVQPQKSDEIRKHTERRQNEPVDIIKQQETISRLEKLMQPQKPDNTNSGCSGDGIDYILASIDNATLRQFTYMAHVLNPSLGKDELIREGRRLHDAKMEEERQKLLAEEQRTQRKEMEAAKMPQEDITRALETTGSAAEQLEQLYQQTSDAIIKENKRKESLKIILKAIKSQGFIVNPSEDIVRQGDQVVLRAHKAGGQVAKFTVNLSGKFIYDFGGYDGQACQNDIEPFLKDLEEVYGVNLVNRHEIWKNPDRLQNNKMQAVNAKKDTN